MFEDCAWLNQPARWEVLPRTLSVVTDHGGDFWRQTHYGFSRHSGHLFGRAVTGDFTATLRVRARYEAQFDQAGIMVRVDEARWVKTGIEFCDGHMWLGSVLTDQRSDWAQGAWRGDATDVWIRVTLVAGVLRIHVSPDGGIWQLIRLCPFPVAAGYVVGPMCCTPQRAGLTVLFSDFTVIPPLGDALHTDS